MVRAAREREREVVERWRMGMRIGEEGVGRISCWWGRRDGMVKGLEGLKKIFE